MSDIRPPGLLAAALIATLFAGPSPAAPFAPAPFVGQWVWSPADAAILNRSRLARPEVEPGIWVSTLSFTNGELSQALALSPALVPGAHVAIVVRLDQSIDRLWAGRSDAEVAAALDARLRKLMTLVGATGITISEVQLDYDSPVRLLPRWAAAVGTISAGALAGRVVWITSLVDHLRRPDYGDLFRGRIAGHILQLFDTGEQIDVDSHEAVTQLAARQRIPFRLGLGAFERRLSGGGRTDHRAWFDAARPMARSPWFRGVWVFPAGHPWVPLMEGLL